MSPDEMDPTEQRRPIVDRRRVLRFIMSGATVGTAAMLGLPVAGYLSALEEVKGAREVDFDSAELGLWDAKLVILRGRPVSVVRTDDGYSAVSAVCTHLGCIVKWKKGRRQFFCPCHGGRFDVHGRVLGGPPPRPLDPIEVEASAEKVVVRDV